MASSETSQSRARLDVRRMLLARGWTERRIAGPMEKGTTIWASHGDRDSSVTLYEEVDGHRRGRYTIGFTSDVPARVVVAACEEVAR